MQRHAGPCRGRPPQAVPKRQAAACRKPADDFAAQPGRPMRCVQQPTPSRQRHTRHMRWPPQQRTTPRRHTRRHTGADGDRLAGKGHAASVRTGKRSMATAADNRRHTPPHEGRRQRQRVGMAGSRQQRTTPTAKRGRHGARQLPATDRSTVAAWVMGKPPFFLTLTAGRCGCVQTEGGRGDGKGRAGAVPSRPQSAIKTTKC